jgi:putative aldouronate transport system permease protein
LNSIIVTGAGTVLNLFFSAMIAFPLSKYDFAYKHWITPLLLVTMLFSPGLVPTYILITQFLQWKDTMWVLIIPQIGTTFNIILLRTFFSDIPREIGESAKIDGCSVFREFLTITLPLSMPALATCSVLMALSYWNDWGTPFLYIDQFNTDLYTVQYLMAKLEVQAKSWYENAGLMGNDEQNINSVIMATCIVGTMPIMFVFLYLQKYIVKGMTVGAVKG